MEEKTYYLPVETPDGIIELKVARGVWQNDDDMRVTLSTTIQGNTINYQSDTTEDALVLLAKDLPKTWKIRSCLSCRYGNFCPVGNFDNELFCVADCEPKTPRDLWHVTEDERERKARSRTLFECCELYKEQSEDYFMYNDYYIRTTK